jgi:putative oxidoreductase
MKWNDIDWHDGTLPVAGKNCREIRSAYVQFIGGLLLVVGLLTPLAAFGIGVTMVVAVVMLVRAGESFINPGGHSWESAALYAVVMLCLMMLGAGRYALDAMLFTRDSGADRAASSIARGGGAP